VNDRTQASVSRATRGPTDPLRRQRIIDAALELMAEGGVSELSFRKIATRAGVPLGSTTYHFSGMHEILLAAFGDLVDVMSQRYEALLAAASDAEQVEAAIVEIICGPADRSDYLELSYELYFYASKDPDFREVFRTWQGRSHHSLSRFFDARACRGLDALVEGLTIHRSLESEPLDRADVAHFVHAIAQRSA